MDEAVLEAIKKLGVEKSPGSSINEGWTYNPIPFMRFREVPCHRRKASWLRWEIISKHIGTWTNQRVLDIGCATGFFAFCMMKKGARVYGVDKDPAALNVCRAIFEQFSEVHELAGAFGQVVPWVHEKTWEMILALNVLNWMGKAQAENFVAEFEYVPRWFVEIPLKDDGMGGAAWLKTEDDVRDWLRLHLHRTPKLLGSTMGTGGRQRALWIVE